MAPSNIISELAAKKPRERAGSRSSNRFSFQQSWALCLLLELHEKGEDYLVVFDYHDDVVVFDSESAPTSVHFYQIKSKDTGNWTIDALVKKKPEGSILGKMFLNSELVKDLSTTSSFVSNAQYNVKLALNPDKQQVVREFTLEELCSKSIQAVSTALQAELNLDYCPISLEQFACLAAKLNLDDHVNHSLGRLTAFLEKATPGAKLAVPAAHKAMRSLIQIKNDCEELISTGSDLIEKKGIGKSEFTSIIDRITRTREYERVWSTLSNALLAEGVSAFDVVKYQTEWTRYEVARMDPTNAVLAKVQNIISYHIQRQPKLTKLSEFYNNCIADIESDPGYVSLPVKYFRPALTAMILMERYELEDSEISEAR